MLPRRLHGSIQTSGANIVPFELELGLLDVRTGRTLDVTAWESGARVDRRFAEAGAVGVLCQLRLGAAAYVMRTRVVGVKNDAVALEALREMALLWSLCSLKRVFLDMHVKPSRNGATTSGR